MSPRQVRRSIFIFLTGVFDCQVELDAQIFDSGNIPGLKQSIKNCVFCALNVKRKQVQAIRCVGRHCIGNINQAHVNNTIAAWDAVKHGELIKAMREGAYVHLTVGNETWEVPMHNVVSIRGPARAPQTAAKVKA